jgi:hypothetical protein
MPAPIWTVLIRSTMSISMALAPSVTLKVSGMEGLIGLVKEDDALTHNSVATTAVVANSILLYSQSNTR